MPRAVAVYRRGSEAAQVRSLAAAMGLFSVLPVPNPEQVDRAQARRAMLAFPWLGLLLGSLAAACYFAAAWRGAPVLGAVLALAALAGLTGALHLDGVADTADGLGSRKPAPQALEIMRRSDIGPMGVVALLAVLGTQAAALLSIDGTWTRVAALACAPMLSRACVTVVTTGDRFARSGGFGALFRAVTPKLGAGIDAALVALVAFGLGWLTGGWAGLIAFGVAAAVAVLAASLWGSHLVRRIGGWTGDLFGSLIEVTAMVFLATVALIG